MSLTFDPHAGLIVVPTVLWGPSGEIAPRLALDTGATRSLISWDVLIGVGYDPSLSQARVRVTTGSAVEFVPTVIVQKVRALDREHVDFPLLCHNLPPSAQVDGLLGLDFFCGQRLVIDFRASTVILE